MLMERHRYISGCVEIALSGPSADAAEQSLPLLAQARPASAKSRQEGEAEGGAVSKEEAVAAVEEEWSTRLNSSLALNQDLEARVAELQKQGSRMRRSVCLLSAYPFEARCLWLRRHIVLVR